MYCLGASLLQPLFANPTDNPKKIALIIAIGDYEASTGWMKINSGNDVPIIKDALIRQGFSEDNIAILRDAEATKEGILKAIRQHLVDKANKGDMVYFQFSGHGQQVIDDNGDEIDGFDEAIVPINSPMAYQEGVYEGQNLIRDEELGSLLNEVRLKLGPAGNLMTVIDACHSGTGTRGFSPARGTEVKMAPAGYAAAHRGSTGEASKNFGITAADETLMAPMVAFFGASANQLNFETLDEQGRNVGSLSYAFSKKFVNASAGTTYRGLFDQIKVEMGVIAPRQQPQVEGTLDQEILGGQILGTASYYTTKTWNDPGSIVINGGWMQGLAEGSVVGFFKAETRDPWHAVPMAKGTVSYAQPLESTVILDADLGEDAAKSAWVYVLEKSFGNLQVNLRIDLPEGNPIHASLLKKIEEIPPVKLSDAPELTVTSVQDGKRIQLLTGDGFVVDEFNASMTPVVAAERLLKRMMNFGQAKFLKNMEHSSYNVMVEFEIIPVVADKRTLKVEKEIPLTEKTDDTGNLRLKDGDYFKIKLTNHGDKAAYFNLVDIQPDNEINVLIPHGREQPEDMRLAPGQTLEFPRLFEIHPPYGTEVFKLIAADQPIDLRSVSTSRGQGTKASPNPLERLFGQTYFNDDIRTRGGRTVSVSAASVNVHTVSFVID